MYTSTPMQITCFYWLLLFYSEQHSDGPLEISFECTAISMRHAAVSVSKCTPVHAVYKVHPDSD